MSLIYGYFQEDKSGSAGMSAYERLFGSSRETSLSPPESPGKRMIRGSSGESSLSPIMSPVFKSDAAKAIMQEVGVVSGQKRVHRRIKKRSLTITGSTHPAVMEALQGHNARVSIKMSKGHQLIGRVRVHPFKTSAFLRGGGVKNWPNLPMDSV